MILGIAVGVLREAPIAPVRWFATGYVELFRNIPVLVQLFFVYFVMPRVLPLGARQILFDFGWEPGLVRAPTVRRTGRGEIDTAN